MIKPWLFEFLPELGSPTIEPNAQDVAALFGRYLDLWVRDEALGFEGIFFSEHHFGRSYSPSPNLLIAALGPRTKKLRLGVMGVVLPYYHPARVVEEIGMLDHLTGGRLEIGTAVGVPQELSRLNMTMAEARERNDEIVAFLDAALTNRIVSYRGKYFSFSNVRLLPRPLQQPFPPRWTTVIPGGGCGRRLGRQPRSRGRLCGNDAKNSSQDLRSLGVLTSQDRTHPRIRCRSCYRRRSLCGCAGCERGLGGAIRCDARARFRSVRDHAWAGHDRTGAERPSS